MRLGVRTGAFPGGSLLVAKDGDIVLEKAYGYTDSAHTRRVSADSTLYDLASVKQDCRHTPGCHESRRRKLLDISAPASRYIPGLRQPDKRISPSAGCYSTKADSRPA